MNGRRLSKKGFEIVLLLDLPPQPSPVIAGQPANDPIDLFFRATLVFRLFNVQRINAGK
ncbi:MAG TPA: hypothetical protein VJT80_12755 [Steroidobacteraceae bacterium]|nr:hypothetical protein [Steroidobacteraceae bacterium]